jgi:hypothetical protein
MKNTLRILLLLLAASPALAKTYVAPTLDSTGTLTFEIPRVMTGVTLAVTAGGGWVHITADTGETIKYYVGQGSPYTANFVSPYVSIPSTFTKLAASVTFAPDPGDTVTQIVVTNLTTQDRYAASYAIRSAMAAILQDGVVTAIMPQAVNYNITAAGFQVTVTPSTTPTTIPVSVYDQNGAYLGTVNLVIPVF